MARSLNDRFDDLVDRTGDHHVWTGSTNPARGTGQMRGNGKITTAHRVAWELEHGEVPDGSRVLPCPDEPRCVQLEHLSLDRQPQRGARRPRAKGTGSGTVRTTV